MDYVFFFGTDAPSRQLVEYGFEWEDDMGHIVEYRGKYLNKNHSLPYRARRHVPLMKREQRRRSADAAAEWWISNWRPASEGLDEESGYDGDAVTLLHYSGRDHRMKEAAETAASEINSSRIERGEPLAIMARPDLPAEGMRHPLVMETVMPLRPFSFSTWENAVYVMLDAFDYTRRH